MIGKRAIVAVAGSLLVIAATSGLVLAHGFGGPGGGRQMWLLARAAGLNHEQIRSAFKKDENLKTARSNLKAAHEAMMSCLVSSKDCTTQISSFSNALQTMAQEQMTVWHDLFKNAPNQSQAATVYSQLKQMRSERMQLMHSVLGFKGDEDTTSTGTTSSDE
jgi:hypothetical protein